MTPLQNSFSYTDDDAKCQKTETIYTAGDMCDISDRFHIQFQVLRSLQSRWFRHGSLEGPE